MKREIIRVDPLATLSRKIQGRSFNRSIAPLKISPVLGSNGGAPET
jgi:hypothetical protein